jgi:hypothetical protein
VFSTSQTVSLVSENKGFNNGKEDQFVFQIYRKKKNKLVRIGIVKII